MHFNTDNFKTKYSFKSYCFNNKSCQGKILKFWQQHEQTDSLAYTEQDYDVCSLGGRGSGGSQRATEEYSTCSYL